MAAKLMLLPSVRSKFVKDDNMKLIYYSLIVLSVIMIFTNYYMYSFMYAVKLSLMIIVSIIATVETEILFYSHDKDINRKESKGLIKKSYPKITALIYVLLIPIGTPLWLVALGAVLATLLGKLLFGGFAHMIFHTSLVGVILVTMGWPQLVDGVSFMTSFDNYVLDLLFNNDFFNNTLSIGSLYEASGVTTVLDIISHSPMYSLLDVSLGIVPGIVGSGIVLLAMLGFLIYKKAVNWITPVTVIVSFLITAFIIGLVNNEVFDYALFQLFSGSLLFVVVFVSTDPITTPVDSRGKVIFGVVVGALTMIIRNAGKYPEGIFFAILFMMMLTPMINQSFKKKKAPKKLIPKKEGA